MSHHRTQQSSSWSDNIVWCYIIRNTMLTWEEGCPWNSMYFFSLSGTESFWIGAFIPWSERSERTQKKKPINTFAYSCSSSPWKADTTLTCQSVCNFFTSIQPTILTLRTKDSLWSPGLRPLWALATPAPCHPCPCHPCSWFPPPLQQCLFSSMRTYHQ